jgi:hypothetical protein
MVISGTLAVDFRGATLVVNYTRVGDAIDWQFADDHLNDDLRLTGQERRTIQHAIREHSDELGF